MTGFVDRLLAAAPLFALIFLGYALVRWLRWPASTARGLTRLVFDIALPALLFYTLCDFSHLPHVDARLLIAFFGGALLVFVIGRLAAAWLFRLDGVSASVYALGGIFSNNAMLGLPIAKATLGEAAVPVVAMVLAFNAMILWSLVTVSVEWARAGDISLRGFGKTLRSVLTNPLIIAILCGCGWGLTGWPLPGLVKAPLSMLADAATPLSLLVLGMGLARYAVGDAWRLSLAISATKLLLLPLVVLALARVIHLPILETQVIVLLSSMATGVNVYLMSHQFRALQGPTAAALLLTTVAAAVTTPLVMTIVGS